MSDSIEIPPLEKLIEPLTDFFVVLGFKDAGSVVHDGTLIGSYFSGEIHLDYSFCVRQYKPGRDDDRSMIDLSVKAMQGDQLLFERSAINGRNGSINPTWEQVWIFTRHYIREPLLEVMKKG